MKRLISVFVAVAVLMCCLPFAVSASAAEYGTGTYLVTSAGGVRLYDSAQQSLDFATSAPEGAYLTVIRVSGDFGYTIYDSVYGWIDLTYGVEYKNSMPAVTDKNKIDGAKAIHITRVPDKTVYVSGEESADITGLEVSIVFNDELGSMMPVTGYRVAFPDLVETGRKSVTVYYGGFSTTFGITVVRVPVTGIMVTKPTKTTYIEGEPISFDGLAVTAYFSDGRDGGKGIVLSESEYTLSGVTEGDTTLAPGDYQVTVNYMYPEIIATFHIYVTGKSVTSLKLLKLPSSLILYQGQTFNTNDFELSATYDNGETEIIKNFDIQYDNMTVGTGFTARIYYMDKYVAFEYSVREIFETGIELGDTARVGSYVDDEVNFSRLEVYVVYNSGEKKLIEDYSLTHEIDITQIGKYPVTVTYGDYTAKFDYTVAKRIEIRIGDINNDGKVNAADARLALRGAAKVEPLEDDAFYAGDVDADGKITAKDARKILRVAANIDTF